MVTANTLHYATDVWDAQQCVPCCLENGACGGTLCCSVIAAQLILLPSVSITVGGLCTPWTIQHITLPTPHIPQYSYSPQDSDWTREMRGAPLMQPVNLQASPSSPPTDGMVQVVVYQCTLQPFTSIMASPSASEAMMFSPPPPFLPPTLPQRPT